MFTFVDEHLLVYKALSACPSSPHTSQHVLAFPAPHNYTTAMAADNSAPNSMVLTNMLSRNEKWAEAMNVATREQFFPNSAEGQHPKVSLLAA